MKGGINFTVIFIIAILLIVGLLLLILNLAWIENVFWQNFLHSLSTILIVSSLWTFVNQYQLQKKFQKLHEQHTDKILAAIAVLDVASKVGLHQIHAAADDFDFVPWIKNSKNITVLVNDLDPWLSKYHHQLDERLRDLEKHTTFIIHKPNNQQATDFGMNLKMNELIQMGIPKSKITLLGYHSKVNCQIYLSEDIAVLAPLFMGSHRMKPIGLVFMKNANMNSYYQKISADLNIIENDSCEL